MKKVLAVLAVLAVAAAAQAELLASWGANGAAAGDDELMPGYKVLSDTVTLGVTDLAGYNGGKTTTASGFIFEVSNINSANHGLSFGYKVLEDYEILNATITGTAQSTAAGPAKMNWFVDDLGGTAVASIVATADKDTKPFSSNLGTLTGEGNVYLVVDKTAGRPTNASNSNITGVFRIGNATGKDAIELNGTPHEVGAVPEPATMSLLGLGALAMALRRKLRK